MSMQSTMTQDERGSYYMELLGEEYVAHHFGDATPLAVQQLTQNRYRSNPTTMVDHILDVMGLDGAERVLDVGCGNGFFLRDVASRMRAGGTMTAIDIAPGMLSAAKDNVNFRWAPIEWIEGDARDLGSLVGGTFDVVMANYIFHYIREPNPFCAALRAATAPTGRCIVTVEGLGSMSAMYGVHLAALRRLGLDEGRIDGLPHGRRGSLSTHNGREMLSAHFGSVDEHPYVDSLVFEEVDAFMEFYATGHRYCGAQPLLRDSFGEDFFANLAGEVRRAVQTEIDEAGAFIVDKENSVFRCRVEQA